MASSVDVSNVDLDGSVVLSRDQAVGGRAKSKLFSIIISKKNWRRRILILLRAAKRATSAPLAGDVEVDLGAFVVLHVCLQVVERNRRGGSQEVERGPGRGGRERSLEKVSQNSCEAFLRRPFLEVRTLKGLFQMTLDRNRDLVGLDGPFSYLFV